MEEANAMLAMISFFHLRSTSLSSTREKTGIWHVEIGKNFAKNDMTKIFIKHNPNYSSWGIESQKISEIGS